MSIESRLSPLVLLGIIVAGSMTVARGSANAQAQEQFAEAQKKNKQALRAYSWKSRTELALKGESKNVTLEQVRYDLDGKLQKTPLSDGAPEGGDTASAGGRRGRRGGGKAKKKIVEKKKAEFAEMMKALGQLVAAYGHIPPEKMQAFVKGAEVGPGEGDHEGSLRIHGSNVLHEGDAMTIYIDPESSMMKRIEIATLYEGDPVESISEYRAVADGPTYQARTTLRYPKKEVELTIENFEYQLVEH